MESSIDYRPLYASTFDSADFLKKLQNKYSHEEIISELSEYLRQLDEELKELIHRDYEHFINLAGNLQGLEGMIQTVKEPIQRASESVIQVQQKLRLLGLNVQQKLKEKNEIVERKNTLMQLEEIHNSILIARRLLDEIEADSNEGFESSYLGEFDVSCSEVSTEPRIFEGYLNCQNKSLMSAWNCAKMERLSRILPRLKTLILSNGQYDLARHSSLQLSSLDDTFRSILSSNITKYVSLLSSNSCSSPENLLRPLQQLLLACIVSQKSGFLELILEEHLDAVLDKFISPSKLHTALLQSPKSNLFRNILMDCVLHLKKTVTPLLLLLTPNTLLSTVNLADELWKGIYTRLNSQSSLLYANGVANAFHSNYLASTEFLNSLNEILPFDYQREQFSTSPRLKEFKRGWNLPIYFSLCFQNIATPIANMLKEPLQLDLTDPTLLHLNISKQCKLSVQACFDPNVFLAELLPNFTKLAVQIFGKYLNFAEEFCESLSLKDIPNCIGLCGDIMLLNNWILSESFINSCFQENLSASNICTQIWNDVSSSLIPMRDIALSRLSSVIVATGTDCLKDVSKILTTYRMTGKPLPTTSSSYMSTISQLFRFLSQAANNRIPISGIITSVCQALTDVMEKQLVELFDAVEKSEKSMKKLANNTSKPNDDVIKIRKQVSLDVIKYIEEVKLLHVESKMDEIQAIEILKRISTYAI